ncbi:MAG: TRIC cation channel family protein [Actinobacteria bacterium]|nr:TRIC cation channel family protein [Actinomycetota bacterium]MCB8996525.1 TRIC cation channel family protein [Actinomycetota bacterium]MCB9415344.1 TRIC cation channel family protein [Actinomycetota bacterium]HRY08541.1 TRIC cation channel family protein [Candidatus Nanopelagicales bacterium]
MNDAVQSIALPNSLDALAIGVGAISGALHARRRHMDVMGILVVAFCAALGGGVIRDILLVSGPPVFLTSPVFLIYAAVGATIGWLFSRYASRATILMEVIDGLFIGVWVLVGATKALGNGLGFGSAILVAVITATGGGVLRDLFSGEQVSLLLPGQWLAAAALMGALTFTSIFWTTGDLYLAEIMCIVVASGIRMVSSAFDLHTPMPMDLSRVLARTKA